tara:strand:+ start:436 stop:1059 length:624 start_codon:yes stop_codon:yes gene_type:complete
LNIKSILGVLSAVKEYLFPYEKLQRRFTSIKNLEELEIFIKQRSAFVTQTTLYGYLKTRMGLKYTMMFTDEIFLTSVNKSKWNIYAEAVSDLTLYTISYLQSKDKLKNINVKDVYSSVLFSEKSNGMPEDIIEKHKNSFTKRLQNLDIINYHDNQPFENSGKALYNWSPIADELKILDKEIVLNSIKNKWKLVVADFLNHVEKFQEN